MAQCAMARLRVSIVFESGALIGPRQSQAARKYPQGWLDLGCPAGDGHVLSAHVGAFGTATTSTRADPVRL